MQFDVYFFFHASKLRMGDFYCTSQRCGQWGHFIGLKNICTTPDNKIVPDTVRVQNS